MNTISHQIKDLHEARKSWPVIFREILSNMHPGNRTYVHLFCELARACKIEPELMDKIRYWNYWHKEEGYSDEELVRILEGKISLKK